MKFVVAVAAVCLFSMGTASAEETFKGHAGSQSDANFYTLKAPKVVEVSSDAAEVAAIPFQYTALDVNGGSVASQIDALEVIFEKIVNLGSKVWTLVEKNKPSVNVQSEMVSGLPMGNALPVGISSWQDLQGWSTPVSKSYRVTYENLYGMTVVDLTYRVIFTAGGSFKGKGAYLTHVTVVPANVYVIWGFKLNMFASIPSVTNAGPLDSPVAGAEVQVNWSLDTVMTHIENTANYYVRGDGQFTELN